MGAAPQGGGGAGCGAGALSGRQPARMVLCAWLLAAAGVVGGGVRVRSVAIASPLPTYLLIRSPGGFDPRAAESAEFAELGLRKMSGPEMATTPTTTTPTTTTSTTSARDKFGTPRGIRRISRSTHAARTHSSATDHDAAPRSCAHPPPCVCAQITCGTAHSLGMSGPATRVLAAQSRAQRCARERALRTPTAPISATMQRQRSAIESFYMFKAQAENDAESVVGDRIACRTRARAAGMTEGTLRAEVAKLPPGLENTDECLTLRRHVNHLLRIPPQKGVFHWRIAELKQMVLASFEKGPTAARHEHILGELVPVLGKNAMNTHRNALEKWRKEKRGSDDDYFASLKPPGRPTLLSPVEEQFVAETIDLSSRIAYGKDRRLGKAYLRDFSNAVGVSGGGSRAHLQGLANRVTLANGEKLRPKRASNMSTLRAVALTPEKHAKMFGTYKKLLATLKEAGRFRDSVIPGTPDADTHFNTDEVSPEYCGKYAKILCSGKLRKWRVKEGEHNPFHATGVVTVCGNGTLLERASGVCHTSAAGGSNAHSLNLWARCFLWTTASGHMDEMGFFRLAELFIAAVGKEDWDCNAPWDDQPAKNKASFERRPILWLLDGHYSHQYAHALDLLAQHDVHVFYTAAGSSEVDQVCDCGVMAHLQTAFGQALDDWRASHVGLKWRPADWNLIFRNAVEHLRVHGGPAITSAWKKTGWYPLDPHAENYPPELYDTAVTEDPRGAARMAANGPKVQMLRPVEKTVSATVLRSRGDAVTPAQSVLIAKTALDFFLKSTVIPAAQAKKEAEAVMAASKEKPLVPEPEATDGLAAIQARSATACGAVGTVEEFRANRHAGLAKRTEKAQKKAAAKRKREEDEIARRTKACHEGAKIEALLVGGKELRQLTVADLTSISPFTTKCDISRSV